MSVTKTVAELYKVRGQDKNGWNVWGDITLQFGETSVHVIADSDYGHFAHYWGSTGPNPKEFLTKIDWHYTMKKLTNYDMCEPDTDKYDAEVKRQIISSRKEGYITKEEAREAWGDMLGIYDNSRDLYYQELIEHELFEKIFGDYEYLPSAERVKPGVKAFWEDIWTPFVEELKKELAAELEHMGAADVRGRPTDTNSLGATAH